MFHWYLCETPPCFHFNIFVKHPHVLLCYLCETPLRFTLWSNFTVLSLWNTLTFHSDNFVKHLCVLLWYICDTPAHFTVLSLWNTFMFSLWYLCETPARFNIIFVKHLYVYCVTLFHFSLLYLCEAPSCFTVLSLRNTLTFHCVVLLTDHITCHSTMKLLYHLLIGCLCFVLFVHGMWEY